MGSGTSTFDLWRQLCFPAGILFISALHTLLHRTASQHNYTLNSTPKARNLMETKPTGLILHRISEGKSWRSMRQVPSLRGYIGYRSALGPYSFCRLRCFVASSKNCLNTIFPSKAYTVFPACCSFCGSASSHHLKSSNA